MKKCLFFLFFLVTAMNQAKAISCSISGNTEFCPGSVNTYVANKDISGSIWGFTKLVWNISGNGHFPASLPGFGGTQFQGAGVVTNNGHTLTVMVDASSHDFSGSEASAIVAWDNTNDATASLSATYTYFLGLTISNAVNVQIGVIGSPTEMNNYPLSICTSNNAESFTISCPNGLSGTNADSYYWSATNAGISGSGSSATLQKIVGNNNTITVSVWFRQSSCGVLSIQPYTITIPRCTGVPTGYPTRNGGSGALSSVVVFTFSPGTGGTSVQTSMDGVNYTSTSWVDVDQGTTVDIWARSVNDCGPGPAQRYPCTAPPCPKCLKSATPKVNEPEESTEVKLFPNPASSSLSISLPLLAQPVTISILNMTGQVVKQEQLTSGTANQLDIESLAPGMYVVHVLSKDGAALNTTQKLLIAR